ncbi:hypothetical protein [Paraburkholderia sp. BCC1886]|uniref:hypothetical protein n=1 Tax=Paraburkholderia sp. BCC1886 TaxID=2562670 RepID=UPI0011835D4F|nr:hypothetical protein [Paraburkholderia sp. BCC1886]
MYNNTDNLPVSADQLQWPYLNLGPQNPPMVGQLTIENWMGNYVPLVAGLAADEIQRTAESNPLRKFFFNLMAQNQFNNPEFTNLVQAIIDFSVMTVCEQPHRQMENVIEGAVPEVIEMLVATMLKLYRGLRRYINPNSSQPIDNLIYGFENLSGRIERFRQQNGYLQYPPQQQYSNQQRGGYAGNGGGGGYNGYQQRHPGGDPRFGGGQQQQQRMGYAAGGANSPFTNGQQQVPANPQGRTMGDRYSSAELPNMVTPRYAAAQEAPSPVQHAVQERTPVNAIAEPTDGPLEDAQTTKLKWTPSEHQPYHPSYNPVTHQLFYQRLASGQVNAFVTQRKDIMDYDRHKTSSAFGPMAPSLDLTNTDQIMKNLNRGVVEIEQERVQRTEELPAKLTTRVREAWYADVSVAGCWLKGAVEWANSTENGVKPEIFRLYAQVTEAAVGLEDESAFVDNFRDAETFLELKEALNNAFGDVSPALWYRANKRATDMVNRVLALNMSVTEVSIDSFTHDIEDLLAYLNDSMGELIFKAFVQNQRTLIRGIFETVSEDTHNALTELILGEAEIEGKKPKLTFLVSNVSFTYLNCLSHQLSIEFAKDIPAVLLKSQTPVLYQVIKDAVEEAQSFSATVDRVLIQTLDGKILEADVGFLGDELFVIRLLK